MAPSKAARAAAAAAAAAVATAPHDDKTDATGTKEKEGGHPNSRANPAGKHRRSGSGSAAQAKEAAKAEKPVPDTAKLSSSSSSAKSSAPHGATADLQAIHWPTAPREILHNYRRRFRLNTPTAFTNDSSHRILTMPAGIGAYSPSMPKRQTSQRLAMAILRHFDAMAVPESDIIVDFLHKIHTENEEAAARRPSRRSTRNLL